MKTKIIIENPHNKTTIIVDRPLKNIKEWFYGGSIVNEVPCILHYETLESSTEKEILKNGHISISVWNCGHVSISSVNEGTTDETYYF